MTNLPCTVLLSNKLDPVSSPTFRESDLTFFRTSKTDYYILLYSLKDEYCMEFKADDVKIILENSVSEGKAAILFDKSPYNLYIEADPLLLKSFIFIVKYIIGDEFTKGTSRCSIQYYVSDQANISLCDKSYNKFGINLFPKMLVELHINNINITSLGVDFLNLESLRVLDVSHNLLVEVPIEISKLELYDFNISYNKFTALGSKWMDGKISKTLRILNFSNNELIFIPKSIVKLYALVELNVDNNKIETLPTSMGALRKLRWFSAANNSLLYLPSSVINWQLEGLNVSNNKFNRPYLHKSFQPNIGPPQLFTLKQYATRQILRSQIPYSSILPKSLTEFLDYTEYCTCANAFFNRLELAFFYGLSLQSLATNTKPSSFEEIYVPTICYFCSLTCFYSAWSHFK